MAATNLFLSAGATRTPKMRVDAITTGATTTSTDYVEVRILTVKADGTTATNVTRTDVLRSLKVILWFILSGGLKHLGAGIPDCTTGQA
jgi:hypothetical protein